MLSEKMLKGLNDQINAELFSAYIYHSMAAYFHSEGWEGMAGWMEKQAMEEQSHAMKIYGFIIERGGRVIFQAIPEPQAQWDSPLHVFKEALKHEEYVTSRINKLMAMAKEENDYATEIMLQWFVTEQVEEEAAAGQIIQTLERIGGSSQGLIMLDVHLGKRE